MQSLTANGPIQNIEQKLLSSRAPSPDKPRMPFTTALELTRDQEDAFIHHVCQRLDQIEGQMGQRQGSSVGENSEFLVSSTKDSWWYKREKYTARYYNNVRDREEANTIYEHSNLTASLSQRITAQMIARAAQFFFGQPDDHDWFSAEGIGMEDSSLAHKVKKFARWKAEQCEVKNRMIQALEFAFVRGESVIKTTHQENFQIYKRTATFLVDADGDDASPILDAHGDYILATDRFIDEMQEAEQIDEATGEAFFTEQPTGRQVLKRDGMTVLPENPVWKTDKITRRLVTFEGPDVQTVYFKDFLCPLDAPSIQKADTIAHLYDLTVMQILSMVGGQFEAGDQGAEAVAQVVETLRSMLSESPAPKSNTSQPRREFGEEDNDGSPDNPRVGIAECWVTYDADGDGVEEEIHLILDRRNRAPIYYEYTANVMTTGLRPFDVLRPGEIDGRWYGFGAMEYFDPEQESVDLQINRKNYRDGASGRVTFWKPWMTAEGKRDPNLKLNHGGTYTLLEGFEGKDALEYITLPDPTGNLMELLQLYIQFMQLKSGVVNGADQQASGLPTADTATGIREVADSGAELFSMFLVRLYPGISSALKKVIHTTFAMLNRRQVFVYFNGPDQASEVLELEPDDVADLALNVKLTISRQRDRQVLEAGAQADAIIDKFYSRPLILQERTKDYVRQQLRSLRVNQGDSLIEPIDPQVLAGQLMAPDVSNGEPLPQGVEQFPQQESAA